MAPKKAGSAAPKKSSSTATHGSYQQMIIDAIIQLKDRSGSSRQAIKKYVLANNNLGDVTDATFSGRINRALHSGTESGVFLRPKGPPGPVKLAKKAPASEKKTTAAKKSAPKEKKETKPKEKANIKKARTPKADDAKSAKTAKTKTSKASIKKADKPKKTSPAKKETKTAKPKAAKPKTAKA